MISRLIVKGIRNVSGIICRENQNTFFDQYPFSKNCTVYDIMLKKHGSARQATDNNTIWCMRLACWILKATNTHSQYVILIAFPWQQRLRKSVSILRHTYIACLSVYSGNWQGIARKLRNTASFPIISNLSFLIFTVYTLQNVVQQHKNQGNKNRTPESMFGNKIQNCPKVS